MVTFFVFDDDFIPSMQTYMIFFCFTRENSGNLQASHDFFFFRVKNRQLTLFFFFSSKGMPGEIGEAGSPGQRVIFIYTYIVSNIQLS